jgi:hypothetical protein
VDVEAYRIVAVETLGGVHRFATVHAYLQHVCLVAVEVCIIRAVPLPHPNGDE